MGTRTHRRAMIADQRMRFCAAIALLALAIVVGPAWATAQRTFVASYGIDTHPCSRTQPCRSFGTALAQTNASGEIIVLDSAGYGTVTITKSVSIIAPPGVYAGITVFSNETGVTVNAAGVSVVLRGLSINGQNGVRGVYLQSGARLRVDRCVVSNMNVAGIGANVSGGAELTIVDSALTGNNYGLDVHGDGKAVVERTRIESSAGDGVLVYNGVAMTLHDVTLADSGGFGLNVHPFTSDVFATLEASRVFGNGMGGVTVYPIGGVDASLVIADSDITRNGLLSGARHGILSATDIGAGVGTARVTLTRTRVTYNLAGGVVAVGTGATAYVDSSVIAENDDYGMYGAGVATIYTRGTNTVHGNNLGTVTGNVFPLGGL